MSGVTGQRDTFLTRLRTLMKKRGTEPSTRDAIAELVQEGGEPHQGSDMLPENALDRQERALIVNVLHLRDTTAYDVMIPRADIVALKIDTKLNDVIDMMRAEGHSRYPVYREQLDDIVGMVHVKDVFAHAGSRETFSLSAILRRPLMVAPQIPVLDLLLQMRQARMHMALVVDEYGGIDGLITIEDLVETIVGDIADEHDDPDTPLIIERADGTADLDARLPVEDFEEKFGTMLTDEERSADIDTVGGLAFTLAGRVPARGEVLSHPSGFEFRVLDADARRIRRLRVKLPPTQTAE